MAPAVSSGSPETATVTRPHPVARAASIGSLTVGVAVLVGWALNIEILRSVVPGLISMKPNTAVCFLLASAALWASGRTIGRRRLTVASATAMGTIAALTLFEYATGSELVIDRLLFPEASTAAQRVIPGRMGVNTAACFLLLAMALLLAPFGGRWSRRIAAWSVSLTAALALLALTGYLFGIEPGAPGSLVTTMAVHTAVLMLVVSVGVLWTTPAVGVPALLRARGPAGSLTRRLLPAAILAPVGFGWVVTRGVAAGLFDAQYGRSMMVTALVIVFCALILFVARSLTVTHGQLLEAERDAETDSMSGLLNRRAIDRRFVLLQPGDAVVLFDLDEFKAINDRDGHAVGDKVLRNFADELVVASRHPSDWFGRLGGDEFVGVLAGASEGGARSFLDRLKDNWVALTPLATYSAGCAIHDVTIDPRQALARADEALYRAKANGRDQWAPWEHWSPPVVGEREHAM
jgi:diguanylate cyclase (GGDEF)-like protein